MEIENLIPYGEIWQLRALMLNVLKSRKIQPEMLKIMTKFRRYKLQQISSYSLNAI